jgi:NADH:ubiquinone oxidoreductase subunit C
MYEEFEGHPLRKDYPMQQSQPRMDLRRKERDAVEEYKTLYVDKLAQARKAEP